MPLRLRHDTAAVSLHPKEAVAKSPRAPSGRHSRALVKRGPWKCRLLLLLSDLLSAGLQLVLSKETRRTRKYPSLLRGAPGHWGQGLAGLSGEGGMTWEGGGGSAFPSWER